MNDVDQWRSYTKTAASTSALYWLTRDELHGPAAPGVYLINDAMAQSLVMHCADAHLSRQRPAGPAVEHRLAALALKAIFTQLCTHLQRVDVIKRSAVPAHSREAAQFAEERLDKLTCDSQ
jgi:hypothetical protein